MFVRWDFYSEEGDIAFGIYKKKGNEKMFIVPKDRVDCHIVSEEGEIPVEPGQCNIARRKLSNETT